MLGGRAPRALVWSLIRDRISQRNSKTSIQADRIQGLYLSDARTGQVISDDGAIVFSQQGRVLEIVPLVLRNILLLVCSLLMYRFWARTKVRRYLWQTTYLNDEPFEYAGRGSELFWGFVLALIVIVAPLGIINIFIQYMNTRYGNIFLLSYAPLYAGIQFLVGLGVYRARRYRLSRTLWRGIRFGQSGLAAAFGLKHMAFSVLTPLTVGFSLPWQNLVLMRHRVNHMWFGDKQFYFDAPLRPLFQRFVAAYAVNVVFLIALAACTLYLRGFAHGAPPSMAEADYMTVVPLVFLILLVSWPLVLIASVFWYLAFQMRTFARAITLDNVRFDFQVSGWGLARLHLVNLLIVFGSFGLAVPFAQTRKVRYYFNHLTVSGTLDAPEIRQNNLYRPVLGEGLAEFFNFGSV